MVKDAPFDEFPSKMSVAMLGEQEVQQKTMQFKLFCMYGVPAMELFVLPHREATFTMLSQFT